MCEDFRAIRLLLQCKGVRERDARWGKGLDCRLRDLQCLSFALLLRTGGREGKREVKLPTPVGGSSSSSTIQSPPSSLLPKTPKEVRLELASAKERAKEKRLTDCWRPPRVKAFFFPPSFYLLPFAVLQVAGHVPRCWTFETEEERERDGRASAPWKREKGEEK